MAPVEKYVQKLIFEQDCVIIPDFGGILSRHIKAGYDVSTGVYRPSRKKVAFNEVLKVDDGLLTYTISVHKKIGLDQAQQEVRHFVVSLWKSLGESGYAEIAGLGKFLANGEGKLIFEPQDQLNFYPEWFGFDNLKVKELNTFSAADSGAVEEPVFMQPVMEVKRRRRSHRKQRSRVTGWAVAATMTGLVFAFSFMYARTSDHIELSSLNPFASLGHFFDEVSLSPEPSKPVVAGQQVSVASDDDYLVDITLDPDSAVSQASESAAPVSDGAEAFGSLRTDRNRFFIITGAYGSNKYVQVRLEELNAKGFKDAGTVIQKEKGWTMVWAGSYATKEEATEDLPRVRSTVGDGVWIFEEK